MQYPDEYLTPCVMSLAEFNLECHTYTSAEPQKLFEYVRLGAGGRIQRQGRWNRVVMDPLKDTNRVEGDSVEVNGDVDSMIAVTKRLPLRSVVSWMPVPPFKKTLTKNVHVQMTYEDVNVSP